MGTIRDFRRPSFLKTMTWGHPVSFCGISESGVVVVCAPEGSTCGTTAAFNETQPAII